MEEKLDQELKNRTKMSDERNAAVAMQEAHKGKAFWSDELEDEYLDNMLRNEGKIQGMLAMLAIMRTTSSKVELKRARIRIEYANKD